MAKKIVCDFCLTEFNGLFHKPEKLISNHYICKRCKQKLQEYELPIKYDLLQILMLTDYNLHKMIINDYVLQNGPEHIFAKFFPMPDILLHDAEHCINQIDAKITVEKNHIPNEPTVCNIADIRRKHILNLTDTTENGIEVSGKLYETEVALYFISPHFINCHRINNIVYQKTNTNKLQVWENEKHYTYHIKNSQLFFLKECLFQITMAAKANKKSNLIYLESDNTITITPGIYSVPKNVKAGTYYISPLTDKNLSVRDTTGTIHEYREGKIELSTGSQLEVTGTFQFRLQAKKQSTNHK